MYPHVFAGLGLPLANLHPRVVGLLPLRYGCAPLPLADLPLVVPLLLRGFVAFGVGFRTAWAGHVRNERGLDMLAVVYNERVGSVPPFPRFEVVNVTRKITHINVDDLAERYLAGEPVKKLAASVGVSAPWVHKKLRERGVTRSVKDAAILRRDRDIANYTTPPHHFYAAALYESGYTQSEIGAMFGTYQSEVSKWMKGLGIVQPASEQAAKRYARTTREDRLKLTANAHAAVRGMVHELDSLEQRARSKEANLAHATDEELAFAKFLEGRGLSPVPQKAVSKYNIDIAVAPVAVEIFGGGWHGYGTHFDRLAQRTKDLADRGWNLYVIWVFNGVPFDFDTVADDLIAFHERSESDPSFRGQHRVVRSSGEFLASGCMYRDHLALIPPTIRSFDAAG